MDSKSLIRDTLSGVFGISKLEERLCQQSKDEIDHVRTHLPRQVGNFLPLE
jgi:hypothetical protein